MSEPTEITIGPETDVTVMTDRAIDSDRWGVATILGTPERYSMSGVSGVIFVHSIDGYYYVACLPDGDRVRLM